MSYRSGTSFTGWLALGLVSGSAVHAQIALDGSVGPAGVLTGPDYAIPAELGQQQGGNLFHSFSAFTLNTGESATFSGPASVNTIIGRVTGGAPSLIDGFLRSDIAGADVYFVNPAGMVFGPNARLEVGGSFYASTADVLHLGADGQFAVANPADSVLTAAVPTAFGFLSAQPELIGMAGGVLQPADGARLGVVAGDILIDGGSLSVPGGRIDLVSVASPGTVNRQADGALEPVGFDALGSIGLSNRSFVGVLGGGDGVFVQAARLTLDSAAQINNSMLPDSTGVGGLIDIRTTESVTLNNGGLIGSITEGDAAAGDIFVYTPRLTVTSDPAGPRSGFITTTSGDGNGGNITLEVGELNLLGINSRLTSGTIGLERLVNGLPPNTGTAGRISITAERLLLTDGAAIDSSSFFSAGRGGDIVITGRESVRLLAAVTDEFASGVSSFASGSGRAGDIMLTTPALELVRGAIQAGTNGAGDAGNISLDVGRLSLSGNSDLSSNSIGVNALTGELNERTGRAGAVTIKASGDIDVASGSVVSSFTLNGVSGQLTITTPGELRVNDGLITATTVGDGDAGSVVINAGRVVLSGDEGISSESGAFQDGVGFLSGTGRSGRIDIHAERGIELGAGTDISTSTAGGDGGQIVLTTPAAVVSTGGDIRASSVGFGQAGAIQITAGELRLSNEATIDTSTLGPGQGGNIAISAGAIDLQSGSSVSAVSLSLDTSLPSGNAGDIVISTGGTMRLSDSTVSSQALSAAGGNIAIDARSLQLTNTSALSASVASGEGGGGNLSVTARSLAALDDSDLTARADQGFGGRITLNAEVFFRTPDVDLNASSNVVGNEGVVEVNAPELDLSGGLAALPESYLAADTLLPAPCGARQADVRSRFTVSGGRVEWTPDDLLPSLADDPAAVALADCAR